MASGCESKRPVVVYSDDAGVAQRTLESALIGAEPSERSRWAARYYDGYLSETLRGDMVKAREAYEEVIAEAGSGAPEVAARAALRLAEIEFLAGRRREAVELMARASVLGRDDIEIVEQADRLQARIGSMRAAGSAVRGPPIGAELASVSDQARERFAGAETSLRAYYRVKLRPRLEQLRAGVRAKENAMESVVRSYRQVLALSEPIADVAAEFRIASAYHDLALSLMFDLPPELEPRAAARLRRSLRTSAISYLRRARSAYERSLAAADPDAKQAAERWLLASDLGLRSVEDLLRGIE